MNQTKSPSKSSLLKRVISWRRAAQLLLGLGIYFLVSQGVSLLWIIIAGSLSGIILGKFFCRWMCPLGFLMETIMGIDPTNKQLGMYQYFKIGCPIAWAGGLFNRISLFKIKKIEDPCASCGLCDKSCYVASQNPEYSLWQKDKKNPSTHFACSRCMDCVTSCPSNKLTLR